MSPEQTREQMFEVIHEAMRGGRECYVRLRPPEGRDFDGAVCGRPVKVGRRLTVLLGDHSPFTVPIEALAYVSLLPVHLPRIAPRVEPAQLENLNLKSAEDA